MIALNGSATTYDVNSLDDTNNGSGTNGTLRYCINQANASAGPHVINFSVAGTITVSSSSLPSLNKAITIDGSTAPGYAGTPVVLLQGGNNSGNGITIAAADCAIFGLQIAGFPYNGLVVSGNSADRFLIGAAGKGNVIISNNYRGIQVDGGDEGVIAFNHVGTDAAGENCFGNGYDGIDFFNGADNDTVLFNHISCNEYNGIQVGGCEGIVIRGNIIGPLANSCTGNFYRGIDLEDGANNCIVGGASPSDYNKIAGNLYWGIEVKNLSVNNLLSGNSYLCNDYGAIEIDNGGNNYFQEPSITSASGSTISGTAPDNAVIEVFKSQSTNVGQCSGTPTNQGADFIGTTTADANGNWTLTGSFGGYVVATARDANGNTSEFSTEVYTSVSDTLVNACEGSITSSFTASFLSSALEICQKQCLEFTDQSQEAVAWQWYFEGASPATSAEENPESICYNDPGTFEVKLVAFNASGDSAVSIVQVTIYATPAVPEITMQSDTLYCTPAFTYQWSLDGITIPGATSQYWVIGQPGLYYVSITDSNGCVSNSVPFTVLPDGIEETEASEFGIFSVEAPNEFLLLAHHAAAADVLLKVFSAEGKLLLSTILSLPMGFSSHSIALPSSSAGIHLVGIEGNEIFYWEKVMVR
jgi:hypothetical protein